VFAIEKYKIPQEQFGNIVSLIHKDLSSRTCYEIETDKFTCKKLISESYPCYKDTNVAILGVFPLKKFISHTPFYRDLFTNIVADELIIITASKCDTFFYKYSLFRPNNIDYLYYCCKPDIKNIFNQDNGFFCYFFDRDAGFIIDTDFFFLAALQENNVIIQNVCTDTKYSIDSFIIMKYGSVERYIELLKDDEKDNFIWLELPKTFEEACNVIRLDYREYFRCYPDDTMTAVGMLIDEIAKASHITIAQKKLLEQNINNSFSYSNTDNNLDYQERKWSNNICIGTYNNICFDRLVKKVLTKMQMETYLEYYYKQLKIREQVQYGLYTKVIGRPLRRIIYWDNYFKNSKKYKDDKDFLRKEVYKK
jgi:hypothetical protein